MDGVINTVPNLVGAFLSQRRSCNTGPINIWQFHVAVNQQLNLTTSQHRPRQSLRTSWLQLSRRA